jgi:hypothetical protein
MSAGLLGGEATAMLREIGSRHGAHVAERVYFRLTGLKGVELGTDDFYRQHPEDEPEETRAIASDLGAAYIANCNWMRKAVRIALAGFDWTPEELSAAWRTFVERLIVSDGRSQNEALLAVLEASPENEPFLEDLFALCAAVNIAKPFAKQHQIQTPTFPRWPNPAKSANAAPLPIELALDMKFKKA